MRLEGVEFGWVWLIGWVEGGGVRRGNREVG